MNRAVILFSSPGSIYAILLLICTNFVYGQSSYPTGTLLDDAHYDLHDAYDITGYQLSIPKVYSMKEHLPKVGYQVNLPHDVGWSIAHAVTLLESSNKILKTEVKFKSPYFINMLMSEKSDVCEDGISLSGAVNALRSVGIPSITDFQVVCPSGIDQEAFVQARSEEVYAFQKVFERGTDQGEIIDRIKTKLALDQPVIVAMHTPRSFLHAKGFWQPKETEPEEWPLHSMVIVAYDDDREGGAFELVNSWGKEWGNQSYIWLRYADMSFVRYGYAVSYLWDEGNIYSTIKGNLNFNNSDIKTAFNPVSGDYKGYYNFVVSTDKLNFDITGSLDKPFYLKMYYKSGDEVSLIYPTEVWRSSLFDFTHTDFEIPRNGNYYTLEEESKASVYIFMSFQNLDKKDFESTVSASNTIGELIYTDDYQVSRVVLWDQSTISFSGKMAIGHVLPLLIDLDFKR